MDDQKISRLVKQRAAVIARLDELDAELRMLRTWKKPHGRGRRDGAAARRRMSDTAKERCIRQREF